MTTSLAYTGIERPEAIGKFSVEENAKRLSSYLYMHTRLMFIGCAQLPSLCDWNLKQATGRHIYEDAEAAHAFRQRVGELRTSAGRLHKAPDPLLELFFDELLHAQSDLEYVTAVYGYIKPKLLDMYRAHMRDTQQIVDLPTIRVLRPIVQELEDQLAWGQLMLQELRKRATQAAPELVAEAELFVRHLQGIEEQRGGLEGSAQRARSMPGRWRSVQPFAMTEASCREPQMTKVHYRTGMGLPESDGDQKLLTEMMRIRQEEMTAAELLAGIIYHQRDMEWEFYYELARHLWDEIRHCMFGQVALEQDGYDWRSQPQYTAAYDLHIAELAATRYAFLSIGVEDAGMKRPGKVGEFEFCRDRVKHPLMAQFQDYDWADEVTHARFGRKWAPQLMDEELETVREMMQAKTAEFFARTGNPLTPITRK